MGAYHYRALKKSGQRVKGVVQADSERHARDLLRQQALMPIDVALMRKQLLVRRSAKCSSSQLSILTRQLATLLTAAIPLDEALQGVANQSDQEKIRQLLIGVRAKVLEGYGLAQAMAEYPQAFPELYRTTIAAGEQTGKLDYVLEKLADYTEQQQRTQQKIQQAFIYPTIMLVVSTVIICFLLAFVVPKIVEVFQTSGQTLPVTTRLLIFISTSVKSYGLYAVLFLILSIVLLKKSLHQARTKYRFDKLLLKLPLVSLLIKFSNVSRYVHTFSILFSAGVSVLETMRVSASLIRNQVMQDAFNLATLRVREGAAIHLVLKETLFLTPMTNHLIASGEKSGQLASMMSRSAEHLDNEVRRIVDTGLTLLEPFVILMMGGVVLFIVLATLLPIFSMESLV